MFLVLEEIPSETFELVGDSMIDIEMTVDGTLFYLPSEQYLAEVKAMLENPNDLSQIYCGNLKMTDLALASHNHDDRYMLADAEIGGGGEANLWYFEVINQGQPSEYLRCKLPLAGDYDIMAHANQGQFPDSIWDSMPAASIADLGGIKLDVAGSNKFLRGDGTWAIVGGSSMAYPSAGLALSSGSAWSASVTNNSANWNTAYGWGNHALAGYAPINAPQFTGVVKLDHIAEKTAGHGVVIDNDLHVTGDITASGEITAYAA